MYRIYYAEKDATLYERYSEQNTGIDEILELTKITGGTRAFEYGEDLGVLADTYNSRILIDFGTEITALSRSIASGDIPALSNASAASSSVFLSLRCTDAEDLLQTTTIKAFPVSESWSNGNGTYSDRPRTKIGVSWEHRSGDAVALAGVDWNTGSAHSKNTSAGVTISQGGGTWITGSGFEASQSLTNQVPDVRLNVTGIVSQWIDSGLPNYGFIVKRPYSDEIDTEIRGSIKFFGRETHTIFVPKLEVTWDDATIADTGSIISTNTYVVYIKNIKPEYRTSETARFRVAARPEFPARAYVTSSLFATSEKLPLSSSYEILDSVTNDIIIADTDVFSSSTTKISTDANGSYFDLRMDSFMPERYYRIRIKCRTSYDTQTFDNFYFRVIN